MTDPSGVPSALGIEAVDWIAEGGENVTVRVTGRWRRRRPSWTGQPMLVVETEGQRQRFPAMPEPPSLTGTAPGTWRMSFSVPASVALEPTRKAWLQVGAVLVPLPVESEIAAAAAAATLPEPAAATLPEPAADSDLLAARRLRSSEMALEAARRRAVEAEETAHELTRRLEQLEAELDHARSEPERLNAILTERERAHRDAEQRAHAERARREELQEELGARARERVYAEADRARLAAVQERVLELESELGRVRREADEAKQVAAAAQAAQENAERQLQELLDTAASEARSFPVGVDVAGRVRSELELARAAGAAEVASPRSAARDASPAEERALALERRAVAVRAEAVDGPGQMEEMVEALRRELQTRAAAEAELRSRLAEAESASAAKADARLTETLEALRGELNQLKEIAEFERIGRAEAEDRVAQLERELQDQARRSAAAYEAIQALRDELEAVRLVVGLQAAGGGQLDPVRLDAAQSRLRETTPPRPEGEDGEGPDQPAAGDALADDGEPATAPVGLGTAPAALGTAPEAPATSEVPATGAEMPATGSARPRRAWMSQVMHSLAERDPVAAGRLVLALLPAQAAVHPEPLAYDLVLEDVGCVQVSVAGGEVHVALTAAPRPKADTSFQVIGDLAGLGRLVASGRPRRLRRRGSRVRGNRREFAALTELPRKRLTLGELDAAGVRMDPVMALTVVALMIDPQWTKGERFTVAHQEGESIAARAYLHVRDGSPPAVTEASRLAEPATVIVGPAEELLAVLDGARREGVSVRGQEGPLSLLQSWVKRTQWA